MMIANYKAQNWFLPLIIIFSSTSLNIFAQSGNGINFIKPKNWEEVLSTAKAQHKSIFVDVYTTWCGPCKMMDKKIYPDSTLGVLINKNFISVKIQMDSTKKDDDYVKSWYGEAAQIMNTAKIEAFPTLLFYAPDGSLLVKTIGYKDLTAMLTISKFAGNTDVAAQFNKDLKEYKDGKRDYSKMIELSRYTKQVLQDDKLALQIAKDYKNGYLDKASLQQFYTEENVIFIRENGLELVSINDKFFNLCYNEPKKIDSILGKGTADQYVPMIIARDEVQSRLYNDGKVVVKSPNWIAIQTAVKTGYSRINAENLIFKEKLSFYQKTNQWDIYTFYMSNKIKKTPPTAKDAFFSLNDPAWNVFLRANDKVALQRALDWSDLSIRLDDNLQFYDTKANLLYKLGKKDEAIKFQKIAVQKNEELTKKDGRNWFPDMLETLDKMQNGQPTWPTKQ